jgi:uncharacterized protein with FMN-binding domain
MKRALLIAGGTVGGLGAVLSVTPPQFGSSTSAAGGIQKSTASTPAQSTPSPAGSSTATTTATTTTKSSGSSSASTTKTPTTKKTTSPKPVGATGTFTGDVAQTQYGNVQVQITVSNGKITSAKALQAPNRDYRSQSISQQAIPYLVEETLSAQSSNIQGVGGASFTSQGWYDSLVSALAKAGMK